jgi:hypothetical protein
VISLKDLSSDLDLVPRRQQVGGEEDHHDPGRAGRSAPCRRCSRASARPPLVTDIDLSMDDRFRVVLGHR